MYQTLYLIEYGIPIRRSENECVVKYQTRLCARKISSLPFHFFAWLYFDRYGQSWLIDTGCTASIARAFGKVVDTAIPELLAINFDLHAAEIDHVILTHLHYDHAGNINPFKRAHFYVQEVEWSYLNSPTLGAYNGDEFYVESTRRNLNQLADTKRLNLLNGSAQLSDDVSVILLSGHSPGLQGVRINLPHSTAVLASDAAHLLKNLETRRPFPKSFDIRKGVESINTLRLLESEGETIIPGHGLPSKLPHGAHHVQATSLFKT
ncbi:N-acyl homoserine lactonase family protein [Halomonas sp. G11]|uniref:N-acyl homoserine lactonase family protein n=1 Tax=Halomonas sp. G11 TaxID=1684425 RepID=UPI0009ECD9BC|nr:N-acyl homoserine lactonase family protein [Halomonas sp. G11]